jgi:hypothetical protein
MVAPAAVREEERFPLVAAFVKTRPIVSAFFFCAGAVTFLWIAAILRFPREDAKAESLSLFQHKVSNPFVDSDVTNRPFLRMSTNS